MGSCCSRADSNTTPESGSSKNRREGDETAGLTHHGSSSEKSEEEGIIEESHSSEQERSLSAKGTGAKQLSQHSSGGIKTLLQVSNPLRRTVSGKKYRFVDELNEIDLDLTYIESNLIAMAAPFEGAAELYRNPLDMTRRFFAIRHRGHFTIYDIRGRLEEKSFYDVSHFESDECQGTVNRQFGFEDHCPCDLTRMLSFCEHIDGYLKSDALNTAAVHCKAGKGRTGFITAALFLYQKKVNSVSESIELFSSLRTKDGKTVNRPSQIRFLDYFLEFVLTRKWSASQLRAPVKITRIEFKCLPKMDVAADKSDPLFRILDERKNVLFDFQLSFPELIEPCARGNDLIIDDDRVLSEIPSLEGAFCVELWDDDVVGEDFICFSWYQSGIAKEKGQISLLLNELDEVDRHRAALFDSEFTVTVKFE